MAADSRSCRSDLCELHGQRKGGVDPASHALLAKCDAVSPDDQWSRDALTGEAIAPGQALQSVAHLCDPLIGSLRAYHIGRAEEHMVKPETLWPELTSLRIEVVAGTGRTDVKPTSDADVRYHIPKAAIEFVELSYAPHEGSDFARLVRRFR